MNHMGKAVRSHGIVCTEQPQSLSYLKPFLIVGLSNSIEINIIHSLCKFETLTQMIQLQGPFRFSQINFIDLDKNCLDNGFGIGYKGMANNVAAVPENNLVPEYRLFIASKGAIHVAVMRQPHLMVKSLQESRSYTQAIALCESLLGTSLQVEVCCSIRRKNPVEQLTVNSNRL